MEKKISFSERFKSSIRFFASLFASREFAVLYCIIGTLAEIAHMYYLTYSISALTGWFKVAQAIMLSGFISSSLLYFVLISDDRETTSDDEKIRTRAQKDSKRINLAINIFTFINIAINFYYYCRHLIIDSTEWQLFDFIFAILVSCLLPITIKLYANGIHVKDWVDTSEHNVIKTNDLNISQLKKEITSDLAEALHEYIDGQVVTKINEIQLPNKEQIKVAFEEHSRLFLNQFENKLKILFNKNIKHPLINDTENISMVDTLGTNDNGDIAIPAITTDRADNLILPTNETEQEPSEVRDTIIRNIEQPNTTSNTTENVKSVGLSIDEYLKTLNQ